MAVGKLEYKKCTRCSRQFPATTEYFYFNKSRNKLHSWCKYCKDEYSKKRMLLWRQEQKKQHEPAKLISTPIKQKNIDVLKEKYLKGTYIKIRQGDQKLYGRITGHYEHFMTVQTSHYITSISYVDILIGAVKIK